jgi:hypothetical protein
VGKLLSSRLLVAVGLMSYSLYLWHQPLLAFARITSLDPPNAAVLAAALAAALLLAALTWRFVEQPFRDRARMGRATVVASAVTAGVFLTASGWVIYVNSGFPNLWPELDIQSAGRRLNATYNEVPFRFSKARFTDPSKKNVLVLGNSFARDFINAGLENGYFSSSEIAYSDVLPQCIRTVEDIPARLRELLAQADYVVVGNLTLPKRLKCWPRDSATFADIGAGKIIVLGTKNFGWNLNAVMRLDPGVRYSYRARVLDEVWERNERVARTLPPDQFVNLLALIADEDRRVPVFTDDRKIISQDRSHLTKNGAKFIGKIVFEHPLLRALK